MRSSRSPVLTGLPAYAVAVGSVGSALLLRVGLDSLWNDRLPYVTFFLAFFVVTRFARVGPSLLAIVAGFLLGDWFFVPPRHSLLIDDPVNRVNTAFYFAVCLAVLFFSRRARRAQEREVEALAALSRLAAIIESSEDAIIGKSLDGRIVSWNAAASALYGYTEAEVVGQSSKLLLAPGQSQEFEPLLERVRRGEHINPFETIRLKKNGELVEISLSVSPIRDSAGQIVAASTIARDIGERKGAERERERLFGELHAALGQVKTLSGLLPICAHCKKIRDDAGSWHQIEVYVRDRSNANFTHGICPQCARQHFHIPGGTNHG